MAAYKTDGLLAASAKTCVTCRFAKINWRNGDEYDQPVCGHPSYKAQRPSTSVQCRKNPPRTIAFGPDRYDGWPWVSGDDWCGEYIAMCESDT